MKSLGLIGKKYVDTIIAVNGFTQNETNAANLIIERNGGIHNFYDIENFNLSIHTLEFGEKRAFIISDQQNSTRTSFVSTQKESRITFSDVSKINNTFDWCHVCYIDDLESFEILEQINTPFSIDFCTNNDRTKYLPLMKKSEVIFDSRERKSLYTNICIVTPIILHDEYGFEIISNSEQIDSQHMDPTKGLNVNGAGDIYAGHFIKNYVDKSLKQSALCAMIDTTKTLLERN